MSRCENWKRLNEAYHPPAGPDSRRNKIERHVCQLCWTEDEARKFVFIDAPYLGRSRVQIVCRDCAGTRE